VSAWIEIDRRWLVVQVRPVALLVSAWIEILESALRFAKVVGRTPCECVD